MIKLNDYIYIHEFEVRRDRPNISVILGKNFNLLVDFGISENHLNEVIEEFTKLGIDYPKVGVLTHFHYDHSFAIPFFKGVTIGCKRSNDYLKLLSSIPMSEDFLKQYLSGDALSFCFDAMKAEYGDLSKVKVKPTDITFSNYLSIDLGDKKVELFHMPSPHSDDAVYIKVNDVLFIGDSYCPDLFNGETTFNKDRLNSLYAIIESFEVTYVVQGHSEVKTKEEILNEILNELKEL